MMTAFRNITLTVAAAGVLMLAPVSEGIAATATTGTSAKLTSLENQVRHELVMLPWLSVFDNLKFEVNGNEVILSGQVTRPVLKSDAAGVVRRITGVETVTNNIEVLPLSPFDDRIRLATYRAVYGFGSLNRYAMGTLPSIRIIVKNGNVTLEGVVNNEGDKTIANLRANQVQGVFRVTNDLRVDKNG